MSASIMCLIYPIVPMKKLAEKNSVFTKTNRRT